MSGSGPKKPSQTHNVKPNRKKDNFEEFNKNEYESEIVKKEQQYKDCLEYIDKLEKEIKRYQSIVPLEALDNRATSTDLLDDIPSHKESMNEYLELVLHNPLLQAYEQNVRSLEKEIDSMENNHQSLRMDLEKAMEENEEIREMLVKKTKELHRALEGNHSIPLPNESDRDRARRLGGTSEEMLNLIETMKNDQEALIDQIESLKIRNENLEKVTEEKEGRFHELQSAAEEANTQYYKLRQDYDKLKHLYDSLQNEFRLVDDKLSKESRDKDEFLSKNKKMESEMSQLNKHLNHLKESYNELSDKKTAEVDALSRDLSDYDLREREFKGRIEILEKSKFDVEEELRQLKRELGSTKSDNQNMVQIMEQYETEIESYKKKANHVMVLTEDCKKKIEEAQLEKDRCSLKEQQYLSKISKLEDDNRLDARDREEKYKSLLDSIKAKQKIILDERESEINELNKRYTEYYSQNEKNKTENERLRAEVNKLEKAIRDSEHEIDKKIDDYERRLQQANENKDDTQRRLVNDSTQLKSEIETLQFELTSQSQTIRELDNKSSMYKNDYDKLAEDHRRMKENYSKWKEDKETAEREANRIKQLYDTRMQEMQVKMDKKVEYERDKHQSKLNDKDKLLKTIKTQEILTDRLKDELRNTVEYFNKLILHLNQENQQYKDQNLELKKEIRRGGKSSMVPEKDKKPVGKSKSRERTK